MLDLGRVQVCCRGPCVEIAMLASPPAPPKPCASPPPVQKEIRDIERDKASGVTIEVQGNSIQKLIGCLKGGLGGLRKVKRGHTRCLQQPLSASSSTAISWQAAAAAACRRSTPTLLYPPLLPPQAHATPPSTAASSTSTSSSTISTRLCLLRCGSSQRCGCSC